MAKYKVCIEKVYRKAVEVECDSSDPDEIMAKAERDGAFDDPSGWSEEDRDFRSIYGKDSWEPLWQD